MLAQVCLIHWSCTLLLMVHESNWDTQQLITTTSQLNSRDLRGHFGASLPFCMAAATTKATRDGPEASLLELTQIRMSFGASRG